MKFCTNCGSQIPDDTKFCPECGEKVAAPQPRPTQSEAPQPAAPVPAWDGYAQPDQGYEAPQQPAYTPPVQQSYEAPQQPVYTPPVQQQSYEAPQQPTYTPPTQSGGGSDVPPTAPAKPAKQPKQGKPDGKKIAIFAGIGVAVLAVIVLVIVLIVGRGGKSDPNLGRYEGVSYTIGTLSMDADGDWIELKEKGKASVRLMGEECNAKWSLDGEKFTLEQAGDKFEGTLKDGTLVIDIEGMICTFAKADAGTPTTDPTETTGKVTEAREVGYWTLLRVDGPDADSSMSEEDVEMFRIFGVEFFLTLESDGTAVIMFDEPVKGTWADGKIMAEGEEPLPYTLKEELLHIDLEGADYVFTRGEGEAPEIDWTRYGGGSAGGNDPGTTTSGSVYEDWWAGKWYGWVVISNANSAYAGSINNAYDVIADIEVYADDSGYIDLTYIDEDDLGWAIVYFGDGTTENGCMVSQSGSIFDLNLESGDWVVDPGVSMVSEFDHMIHIESTMYDSDGDWFDYDLFLRPWGMLWEDVRVADTSDMLYEDMMPLYYDDWYLPQLESGAPISGGTSGGPSGGFTGPTATYDYKSKGAIFFEYPSDTFYFDNSFGIEALENTDGSIRMTFLAVQDAYEVDGLKGYLDLCSEFDEFEKENLTINGLSAIRVTYIDDWGDAAESVYIDLGGGAAPYLAIRIDISAYSKELRDSDDVQNILYSIHLK